MNKHALIGPAVFILLWAALSMSGLVESFFLPNPFVTIDRLGEVIWSGSIMQDLGSTLRRVALAFLIAVAIGFPLGLLLGKTEKVYRSFEFMLDFFRSTPPTALFPLFLLIFGVTDFSKIAVAAFTAVLVIIFNTSYGVMHAKKSRVLAARLMGATESQIFTRILLWESLPQTMIGLRSAASWALVIVIVAEMFIGTSSGLGSRIIDAQITYEIPTMYAVILLTGTIGYLMNMLFLLTEKKLLHWASK